MANYYMEMSFTVLLDSSIEEKWVRAMLTAADSFMELEADGSVAKQLMRGEAGEFFKYLNENDDGHHGNSWQIHTGCTPGEGLHLWLHGNEGCDVEAAGLFCKMYLRKFHPQQAIAFTWCEYADRPIAGSCSGGACFVTARRVKIENAYDIIRRFMRNIKLKMRSGSPYGP